MTYNSSTDPRTIERFRSVGQVERINGEELACQCYTQQGTRMKTSVQFCADAVANGYFDDTRPDIQLSGACRDKVKIHSPRP